MRPRGAYRFPAFIATAARVPLVALLIMWLGLASGTSAAGERVSVRTADPTEPVRAADATEPTRANGEARSRGAHRPEAIIAGHYLAPDGTLQAGSAIVLDAGKIHEIAASDAYTERSNVAVYPDAVVCPGLIDVRSQIGAFGQLVSDVHAIDPALSAIDGLDMRHRDFRAALRAGITTVMIVPSPNNVVGGVEAVVRTADPTNPASDTGRGGATLRSDGPLMFAFGSTVWLADREPTSRIGALALLRNALAETERGAGHERLRKFAAGALNGVAVCQEPMDVDAALRIFKTGRARIAIDHTSDAHELADTLVRHACPVIVGPYTFDTPPRTLATAGVWASAGVPVILAGSTPKYPFESLRITAALAVRYGMDPATARRAITVMPATLAGVSDRVGSIHPGLDADLVVFSDDPLRLDARVLAVYVNGVRVYDAELEMGDVRGARP